ncbi:AAA family ATPase [Paenibacillus sp. N3.4]|uniref:AAA family ATPase n=1 Tax=Paenibacillus sp. N3.4 TaxID=2603222 RepID=UPI00164F12DC|nr:AAA family ATPase [Paenibacillus sp. N3.4]
MKGLTQFVSHWYPSWRHDKVKELYERFGVDENQQLALLSKGTKRKLSFIHAIAFDPKILLMDEPTSGLDPFAWRIMMDEVIAYMGSGDRTVLMATHIVDEVKRLADYVAFIHEGKLLGCYEKDVLLDEWKSLWIEPHIHDFTPLTGVVAIERQGNGTSLKLTSRYSQQTEQELQRLGVQILHTQAVELDEILGYLTKEKIGKVG